ncbi:phage tail protein [Tritonibacter mobilis]|uniref:phage tail protein n=2 Tax=Tritonibacter mobilis TaxID=379347 RepID=UPI0024BBB57E|nr:phage tail protein [Tritonibacter mobilis]WHQ83905.1 phage tail protein [Tritonibacter mobilis]
MMADTMMQLGAYQFSVDNAAYQSLERSTEYRWAAQERVGAHDALQFTGFGADTISLRGVIYPHHKGGLEQLDKMRRQASIGIPLPLLAGTGRILGVWVVESVREGQRTFGPQGAPLRQDFGISIRRYDGGLRSLLPF